MNKKIIYILLLLTTIVCANAYNALSADSISNIFHIPKLIFIPKGEFSVKRSSRWLTKDYTHHIKLTNDFYMSKYEITNSDYCKILNYAQQNDLITVPLIINQSSDKIIVKNTQGSQQELFFINNDKPDHLNIREIYYEKNTFKVKNGMENKPVLINWYGAVFYCNMLSRMGGNSELYDLNDWSCNTYPDSLTGYRLPTEMEWQYVARFDDDRIYPWGSEIDSILIGDVFTSKYANVSIGASCVCDFNYDAALKEVGSYSPKWDSKLGIADMIGNVWEWCNDYFVSEDQDNFPGYNWNNKLFVNPIGPPSSHADSHVLKGGSYFYDITSCGSRTAGRPEYSVDEGTGFRIVKIGNDD